MTSAPIPRILHAIWDGPKPPPMKWLRTWEDNHVPLGWEFRLWNSFAVQSYVRTVVDGGRTLVTSTEAWPVQAQIDRMPELNGKADLLRFCILAKHGGVYVDADSTSEPGRPLDDSLLVGYESWASWENETARPGTVATYALGAIPGARLFVDMVRRIPACNLTIPAWQGVGPGFLSALAKLHPETHIFPARMFCPDHYTRTKAPGDAPIYARQFWGNTTGSYAQGTETPATSATHEPREPAAPAQRARP